MFNRRQLLGGAAAGIAAGFSLPRALASSPTDLKFLFVVNYGGWDPTRVFADCLDNPNVDNERLAERATLGGLSFVDHPERPSVRSFFERWYSRSLIVNGVLVPSVAHENCLRLIMTGKASDSASDWPAILAADRAAEFALPHLVVDGPSFAGNAGAVVARTGSSGQLEGLMSGELLDLSAQATRAPSLQAERRMDQYLAARSTGALYGANGVSDARLLQAYQNALSQGAELKDLLHVMDWGSGTAFSQQCRLALDALRLGVSRCATVSFSYNTWDTHVDNDRLQSQNFEVLFDGLNELLGRMEASVGSSAATLAEEVVVVVLSEMGRTPQMNAQEGKDHWPYTSALIVGPGVTGGRVIGGLDSLYYGENLDFASAEVSEDGAPLSAAALGVTLLALADVDPSPYIQGIEPITGALE